MIRFGVAMTIAIAGSVVGDLCIKKGAGRRGDAWSGKSSTAGRLKKFFTDPWLMTGIGLLTLNFIGMLVALRLGPVTVVVPLMSCTYILTTLLAKLVLREKVTSLRWAGVLVIMFGVAVLGLSTLDSGPDKSNARALTQNPRSHYRFALKLADRADNPQ